MHSKVIFLDVDGVLTSARTGWFNWDIYAVSLIRHLCKVKDVKIVISSSWRSSRDLSFFQAILGKENIHPDWKTPTQPTRLDSPNRGGEIDIWLKRHPEVEKYVILDDDSDMLEHQLDNFIQTSTYDGMLFGHRVALLEAFGIDVLNLDLIDFHQCPEMFAKYN